MIIDTEIDLGDTVKDKYTDLEGTVLAITKYINGCIQAQVVPEGLKDGKPLDDIWIDVQNLKIVKKANVEEVIVEERPPAGGYRSHP